VARSDTTDFVFLVLEGPLAGREIVLSGRALPYRAGADGQFALEREQRVKTVWYQGNPRATQLVFGRKLNPTTINGVWKDRYLGEDTAISLAETFETLCDQGAQLRVSWSTLERQGVIRKLKITPGQPSGGLDYLGWEMTLEWSAESTRPALRPDLRSSGPLRDDVALAAIAADDMRQIIGRFVEDVGYYVGLAQTVFEVTKGLLQDHALAESAAVDSLSGAAQTIGDEGQVPARTADDVSSALGQAAESAAGTAEVLGDLFPAETAVSDDVATLLLQALDRYEIIERAYEVLEIFWSTRVRVEALVRPDVFAVIHPRRQEDLRVLALRYYGNADEWRRIASANGIESSVVPDDLEVLYIPLVLTDALDPAGAVQGVAGV